MIRLRFIAGLENSEHKMKVLEYLQTKADATAEDILNVIQQREQTIRFVKNEPEGTTETVAFVSKNKSKRTFNAKPTNKKEVSDTFDCKKCGKSHKPKSCPAFGKTCNKCNKPNHFANVCQTKANVNYAQDVRVGDKNEEQLSDFSYFIGFSDFVKTGDMTTIKIQDRDVQMMKDTGASLSLISSSLEARS